MNLNTTKYLTATRNLTLEQRGYYIDLMIEISENGPIDYSRLHCDFRFGPIAHLFVSDGVVVDHEELRKDREDAKLRSEVKRKASLERWEKVRGKKSKLDHDLGNSRGSKKVAGRGNGNAVKPRRNIHLECEVSRAITQLYKERINSTEISTGEANLIKLLKKKDITSELLMKATKNYHAHIVANATAPQYVIRMRNFFGRDQRWKDYVNKSEPNQVRNQQKGNIVQIDYSEVEE